MYIPANHIRDCCTSVNIITNVNYSLHTLSIAWDILYIMELIFLQARVSRLGPNIYLDLSREREDTGKWPPTIAKVSPEDRQKPDRLVLTSLTRLAYSAILMRMAPSIPRRSNQANGITLWPFN